MKETNPTIKQLPIAARCCKCDKIVDINLLIHIKGKWKCLSCKESKRSEDEKEKHRHIE